MLWYVLSSAFILIHASMVTAVEMSKLAESGTSNQSSPLKLIAEPTKPSTHSKDPVEEPEGLTIPSFACEETSYIGQFV